MVQNDQNRFNWLFMDMNSYFASVEQHLRPELRGRHVGVIPVQSEGTCVIAASAGAKRMGVKVGTRVRDARELCPGIMLVKARPSLYVEVHHAILRSVEMCAPIHKTYSIDEWAIRLRGEERRGTVAVELAQRIKRQLLADFSPWLTCSIGIASTRLLAKIASDLKKPDGLTPLELESLPHSLEHLQPNDLPGIARSMLARLNAAGVQTIPQLWALSRQDSRHIWGSVQGEVWWAGFHGFDDPEPATHRSSMTHANMLAPEFRNDDGAHGILVRLLCKGAARLRHHDYFANKLNVRVRSYSDREWHGESHLPGTQDTLTILRHFSSMWRKRPWASKGEASSRWRPFAQVSMTLSGLTPAAITPGHLFPQDERLRRLSQAMDELNRRWGQNAVYIGSVHEYRQTMDDKIAFGRIPDVPAPFG